MEEVVVEKRKRIQRIQRHTIKREFGDTFHKMRVVKQKEIDIELRPAILMFLKKKYGNNRTYGSLVIEGVCYIFRVK